MTLIPNKIMKMAKITLKIGSRYHQERFTLINACDITMDMAKMVDTRVLITSSRIELSRKVL